MNKILLSLVALVALAGVAQAQPKQVVTTCGSGVTLSPGDGSAGTVDTTGRACNSTSVVPSQRTSVPVNGTITAGNTFQSIIAADSARRACTIQNTSTHTMYFYLGATASATTSNTVQVPSQGYFYCNNPGGTIVSTDNVAATTSTTSDTFAGFYQD